MRPLPIAFFLSLAGCTQHQLYRDSREAATDASTPESPELLPTTPRSGQEKPGATCTEVTRDPHNCGACGHDCLGGTCSEGACGPVVLARGEIVSAGSQLRVDGEEVYWLAGNQIRHVSVHGGTPATLYQHDDIYGMWGIDVDADAIYMHHRIGAKTKDVRYRLVRVSKATGAATVLSEEIPHAWRPGLSLAGSMLYGSSVRVAGGHVYWLAGDVVYRCPAAESCPVRETMATSPDDTMWFADLAITSGTLFATLRTVNEPDVRTDGGLFARALDGGTTARWWRTGPIEVAADADALYRLSAGLLARIPLAGNPDMRIDELAETTPTAANVAVDDRDVYWGSTSTTNGSIHRCAKTGPLWHCGDSAERVATGLAAPANLVAQGNALYFTTIDAVMKIAKPSDAAAARAAPSPR